MTDTEKEELNQKLLMESLGKFRVRGNMIGVTLAHAILCEAIEEAEKKGFNEGLAQGFYDSYYQGDTPSNLETSNNEAFTIYCRLLEEDEER